MHNKTITLAWSTLWCLGSLDIFIEKWSGAAFRKGPTVEINKNEVFISVMNLDITICNRNAYVNEDATGERKEIKGKSPKDRASP